jgi:hypothetical protein
MYFEKSHHPINIQGSELKIFIIKIKGIISSTPLHHNWQGGFLKEA